MTDTRNLHEMVATGPATHPCLSLAFHCLSPWFCCLCHAPVCLAPAACPCRPLTARPPPPPLAASLLATTNPTGGGQPLPATVPGSRQFRVWWPLHAAGSLTNRLCAALSIGHGHIDTASYFDVFRKKGEEMAMTDVMRPAISHELCHLVSLCRRMTRFRVFRCWSPPPRASTSTTRSARPTCPSCTPPTPSRSSTSSHRSGTAASSWSTARSTTSARTGTVSHRPFTAFHCPFTAVSVSFAPPFTAVRLPCRSIPADAIERGLRVFFVCGDEAARICRVDAALAVSVCVMYLAEQENGSSTKQALQVAPRAPHDLHTPCTPRPAAAILRRIVACRGALILRTTPHQHPQTTLQLAKNPR